MTTELRHDGNQAEDELLSLVLGLFVGAVCGGIAGLLLAPKKGEAIREDIQEFLANLPERVEEDFKSPSGKTRTLIDRTRYGLENKIDRVSKNIQAGKMAEAKKREELASGLDYL